MQIMANLNSNLNVCHQMLGKLKKGNGQKATVPIPGMKRPWHTRKRRAERR